MTAGIVDTATGKETAIGGFKTDDGESGNGPTRTSPTTAVYSNGKTGKEFVNGYCLAYHKTVQASWEIRAALCPQRILGYTGVPWLLGGRQRAKLRREERPAERDGRRPVRRDERVLDLGHTTSGATRTPTSLRSRPPTCSFAGANSGASHRSCRCTDKSMAPIFGSTRGVTLRRVRQRPKTALDNYAFYATLHTRLFPYIYTYAKQSNETGLPIMRPLVLIHPDDPKTFGIQHAYYFGAELLIAPVIEPNATGRQVYLPKGDWFDFWTNERHAGTQDIAWTNPAQPVSPHSKIPVFVRSGAIVPLILGDGVQTLCDPNYVNNAAIRTWDGGLEVRVYPAGSSQFTIFDGTDIRCDQTAASVAVTFGSPTMRPILMRIVASRPAAVERDGAAMTEVADPAAFDAASEGWRFDDGPGFVLVKFSHSGATTRISF